MTLQEILAQLLNPNGSQQAQPVGMVSPVGDHALTVPSRLGGMPPQMPQQAPQQQPMPPQAPQGQPMAQPAPQPPQQPQSGGLGALGGILQNIISPQSAGKNKTVGWLTSQGMDPGMATVIASDKGALRQFIMSRSQGQKPIEIAGRLVDPTDYHVIADFSEKKQRDIRNDANGVPRYSDSGEAVFPSDQNASGGTQFFSGKSVEAQGLNYLIGQGTLSKEQAANVAAGKAVTGPNGEIIFMTPQGIYQQPAAGGSPEPVQPGGNIPITGPKYSEDMRKAGGFAMRAEKADQIVSQPDVTAAGASLGQNAKSAAPFGLGNYIVSSQYQQFDQAQRDFINAVLRRESGAAISESEFQNARKQYLPQPGDGADVIAQKAENRRLAVQSLHQSADPVPSLTGTPPAGPAAPQRAPTAAAPAGEDAPPASYTGKNWKWLTPEQRKLWQ
jgi:hypothetical protein